MDATAARLSSGALFTEAVEVDLAGLLADDARSLAPLGPDVASMLDLLAPYVRGGKMLRPLFVLWGARAAGGMSGEDEHHLVRAGAGVELLQAAALIHDDVIDRSPLRRGRPAMHVSVASLHRERGWHGDPDGFGIDQAILLGDLALSWARDALRDAELHVPACSSVVSAMCSEVISGQMLDVLAESDPPGTSTPLELAERVIRYKTVSYTVLHPLHLGARLAGGGDSVVRALTRVAVPLGTAFQLQDDLLGVFGDSVHMGKSASSDLVEGKRTVLVALTEELGGPPARAALTAVLGNPDATQDDLSAIRSIMASSGARDEVEARVRLLADQARDAIAQGAFPHEAASALTDLVDRSVLRTR